MAIGVEVIPLAAKQYTTQSILHQVAEELVNFPGLRAFWVEPKLLDSKTKQPLPDDLPLTPPLSVWFALPQPCTMQLVFLSNAAVGSGEPDEEYEYLTEQAKNLPDDQVKVISRVWKERGFFLTLTTFGGRDVYERHLLILLATALAKVTNGWIIPTDDDFSIPVGCYSPDTFAQATIRESPLGISPSVG